MLFWWVYSSCLDDPLPIPITQQIQSSGPASCSPAHTETPLTHHMVCLKQPSKSAQSQHSGHASCGPDSIPSPLPPIPSLPTFGMTSRSQHGIFKPNPKYSSQAFFVFFSPIPKDPFLALRDSNWKQLSKLENTIYCIIYYWQLLKLQS